jgi:mono/diheme cytochrome c family protein
LAVSTACVERQPLQDPEFTLGPTATASPVSTTPGTPSVSPAPSTAAIAYTPDLQPIFNSDCVSCHGSRRADAGYRMDSYAAVMRAVRAGSANSSLVVTTQTRGSMYRYFTGDRAAKSQLVRRWVVDNGGAERR